MSFDKFVLAVESRDLSQADKSIITVPSFPKLSDELQNFFSVSQQLRPELSAKVMLSILSPEKLRKCLLFNLANKIDQNINFDKLPSAK